jgi:hypothetical protein
MTFSEFMAEAEFHRPKDAGDYAGSLTRGSVADLEDWMESWDEPAPT